jgi:hypothetical protein
MQDDSAIKQLSEAGESHSPHSSDAHGEERLMALY